LTAAWLHGLDVDPCGPIDVTLPRTAGISARAGPALRRSTLSPADVTTRRGFDTTTVERSLADLSLNVDLTEAVVVADAAMHIGLTNIENLSSSADRLTHRAGPSKLRRVIQLAEPASESPMESRLRMVIVLGGLPRPVAQHEIYDRFGEFVARNRRQNRLLAEGTTLLRFTASDVFKHPDQVVHQVRGMLQSR
jgi:hypothetical protein